MTSIQLIACIGMVTGFFYPAAPVAHGIYRRSVPSPDQSPKEHQG